MNMDQELRAALADINRRLQTLDEAIRGDGKSSPGIAHRIQQVERALEDRPCQQHADRLAALATGQTRAMAIYAAVMFVGSVLGASGLTSAVKLLIGKI
jgi:hypothetical protein